MKSLKPSLGVGLASLWLLFTVCFAIWWFRLSFDHTDALIRLEPARAAHWERQRHMVLWEGSAWLVLLVVGGIALIALIRREKRRVYRLRQFFASFSHEVKTSLASLRLQAEALADDAGPSPVLERLVGDTVRLQLQLENSLFFASQDDLNLYVERLDLRRVVERMREQWPGLEIRLTRDARLRGDERAIRTLFSNLCRNAMSHGRASALTIHPEAVDGRLRLRFEDNGEGYEGSVEELGRLFYRPKPTSGSGLGLYISRVLVEKMGGELKLRAGHHGFHVDILIGGELS